MLKWTMLPLFVGCLLLGACTGQPLSTDQTLLVNAAKEAGATSLTARRLDDGGLLMNGKLEGRRFNMAFPWRWNKQVMLFANGYRPPGFPLDIPENPLADDVGGAFHRFPYEQGFATGRSAYDKPGVGVQTGVESTYRLKRFVDKLGATRTYLMGASMGGDITVALIEKYPQDFAGAVASCGAVGGWTPEAGWAIDIRAAYNYFTRGTAYALPGEQSLARSALSVPPSGLPKEIAIPLVFVQMKRIVGPVEKLFAAAAADPKGQESRMIDNIVAVAGTQRDPAALILPLSLTTLGMDDMVETAGGSIYDNTAKVYSSPYLSAQENAALNAGIERIKADPKAVAQADAWYQPTGKFPAKLLTIYNAIDPMAPSTLHEPLLREAVERAGNLDHLVQRSLPPRRDLVAATKMEGYVHCGFTPDQIGEAWNDLRAWVELDRKPAAD
jgi:pimeloyl-ACP methyl ester carboxylesterase